VEISLAYFNTYSNNHRVPHFPHMYMYFLPKK
jgi:hypothetical protein